MLPATTAAFGTIVYEVKLASYNVASSICQTHCITRHVIHRVVNPCYVASCDMLSIYCQALRGGGV